jgi:two-component system response regulator FlrC
LYFRISTFRLRIQALKDRPGDIVPLVAQSLARHVKGGVPFTVTPEAQVMLQNYPWPGNVRELENVVQRAVVLSGGRTITPAHLMFDDAAMDSQAAPAADTAALQSVPMQALPTPALPAQDLPTQALPVQTMPAQPMMFNPTPAAPMADAAQAMLSSAGHYPFPTAPIEVRESHAPVNLEHAVKTSELQVIMAAIQSTDSRMAAAAKLGISPRTLRYKLAQMRERGLYEGASA